MRDLPHAQVTLPLEKEPLVHNRQEAGWATEPVRTIWRQENSWPYQDSNSKHSVIQTIASRYTNGGKWLFLEFIFLCKCKDPVDDYCKHWVFSICYAPTSSFLLMESNSETELVTINKDCRLVTITRIFSFKPQLKTFNPRHVHTHYKASVWTAQKTPLPRILLLFSMSSETIA